MKQWQDDVGVKFSVEYFVTENATNMVKAMADGNYVHIRCMVHTLHLVVTAALKECQGVTNVILIARKITGFVHRSNKAVNKLNLISRKSLAFPRTLWCMMCQPGGIPPSTDYHECRDGGRCNVTPSVQCRPL